jgi:hypothetical protein
MKRMLKGVFLAGAAFLPAAIAPCLSVTAAAERRHDPRLERLRRFFGDVGCPAVAYAETFLEAADRNLLDWRLLPSISFIESTGGKMARHNNMFGWDPGRGKYANPVDGIHTVAFNLAHGARYRHKSLDQKLAVYNPNTGYARKIKAVMVRISPDE